MKSCILAAGLFATVAHAADSPADQPTDQPTDQPNGQPNAPIPLELVFAAEVAGEPFDCAGAYEGIGSQSTTVSITDFRLYVSELSLLASDGTAVPVALEDDGRWQDGTVALLDFENGTGRCDNGTPALNDRVRASLPSGSDPTGFTGVQLTLGVPFDANHGDPTLAGSPLNLTSMFWNWRGGYRFLKVDIATDGGAWMLHLGSTGCQSATRTTAPESCASPNRVVMRFDDMDIAADTLVIDPAAVLAASDLTRNAPETSPGCMSFPGDGDCAAVLTRLGVPYGDAPAVEQQLMSVRAGGQ